MLDIYYKGQKLIVEDSNKTQISFDIQSLEVLLGDYNVNFPGEYEKSGVLLEVKKYKEKLYYNFLIDQKHLVIVSEDNLELTQEISDFFGDVDILIIKGTKEATKLFENIEAKIVLPYGESKDIFLNTLGQHLEEVDSYKQKGELPFDTTEFVNLGLG